MSSAYFTWDILEYFVLFIKSLNGKFFPPQLIQSVKTRNNLSRVQSPSTFCFNFNPKHYSNNGESIKTLNYILLTYVARKRKLPKLAENYPAFLTMDVFKLQMTTNVLIFYIMIRLSPKRFR